MELGKHGITADTPKNIPFGAGAYYRGLKWNATSSKWEGTCVGATQGGSKLSIAGEYVELELDGALVNWKGQTIKQGGAVSMEINMAELTPENLQLGTHFKKAETSDANGYDLYVDKPDLEDGDYVENFGFVGKMAKTGKNIIAIMEHALCKEAFEFEPKAKENTVMKLKLDAYTDDMENLDTLPVKIYYPTGA